MDKTETKVVNLEELEEVSGGYYVVPGTLTCDICGKDYTPLEEWGWRCRKCYYRCDSCRCITVRDNKKGVCPICNKPYLYY